MTGEGKVLSSFGLAHKKIAAFEGFRVSHAELVESDKRWVWRWRRLFALAKCRSAAPPGLGWSKEEWWHDVAYCLDRVVDEQPSKPESCA